MEINSKVIFIEGYFEGKVGTLIGITETCYQISILSVYLNCVSDYLNCVVIVPKKDFIIFKELE